MTFSNAVEFLRDGYAAKRPSMGGYVFKTVTSGSDAEVETYTLTYRKRANQGAAPVDFVYSFDGSAWSVVGTPATMDAELHSHMIADDWITGKMSDFEASRSGSSVW